MDKIKIEKYFYSDGNMSIETQSVAVNQQSIAEQLNISVGTVSKALRGYPDISSKTREKVMKLARTMGYRSSSSGVSSGTCFIGVLVQSPARSPEEQTLYTMTAGYLNGIGRISPSLNISPIIHYYHEKDCSSLLEPKSQPVVMRNNILSGLIFVHRWPPEVVKSLSEQMPCVSIIHQVPESRADVIGIDSFGGMDALVKHLYELGHRKIGFFGKCAKLSWSLLNYGAYVSALARYELEFDPTWSIDVDVKCLENPSLDWNHYVDFDRVAKYADSGVRAWISSSELAGRRLCKWFVDNGYKVPEDVSVTGFHSENGKWYSGYPSLTNLVFPSEEIGEIAVRRLINRIERVDESPRHIILRCQFNQGESTGVFRG